VDDKGTRDPLTPFSYAEARVGPDIKNLRQVRRIIMDSLTEICSSKCQVVMDDSATVSIEEGRTINVDGHALNSGQSSKSNQE
jgi:hypothetical protein